MNGGKVSSFIISVFLTQRKKKSQTIHTCTNIPPCSLTVFGTEPAELLSFSLK